MFATVPPETSTVIVLTAPDLVVIGEKADDLMPFEAKDFVDALL